MSNGTKTEAKQNCNNCKYLLKQDIGWSNWTVEDTELHCLRGANPELPAEEYQPQCEKALKWSETCTLFTWGEPLWMDVDETEDISTQADEETKQLYADWKGTA